MKYIILIVTLITFLLAQDSTNTGIPHPKIESSDTTRVIIHYYSQQTVGGEFMMAYTPAFAIITKFKTEIPNIQSIPVITYHTRVRYLNKWIVGNQININIVFDIKQTRW